VTQEEEALMLMRAMVGTNAVALSMSSQRAVVKARCKGLDLRHWGHVSHVWLPGGIHRSGPGDVRHSEIR
jgi:hypothetical protein